MENNKLKDIKNSIDGIMTMNNLDLDNILLDEKPFEFFLFYDNGHKTLCSVKSLHSIFDKLDGFIKKYDRTKYLGLFFPVEMCEGICGRIRLKSNISDISDMKIKINSDDDLPLEKTLNMHNVVIFVNPILHGM